MRIKSNGITSYLLIICLVIGQITSGCGKKSSDKDGKASVTEASPTYSSDNQKFTDSDLDQLLAPIALYPDPLIAQILPAATFIDQLDEANRVLGGKANDSLIDQQTWDVAVKSVAHYPQVLSMMVQKQDWTIALGQAYVSQQADVMKSIQRLRQEAYKSGNLSTNEQQKIVVDNGQEGGASDGSQSGTSGTSQSQTVSSGGGGNTTIKIWPAQPQVIYVPQYDPTVVYEPQPQPSGVSTGTLIATSLLTFGAGLAIGSWLNNDCYWNTWGVGYHGWAGGGWVGYSRNYVHINNVYVNDRFRNVNVNRNIVNRNINNYRSNLRVDGNDRVVNRNNFNNNRDRGVNHNAFNNDNRPDALRNRDNNRSQLNNYRGYDKSKALSEAGGLTHNDNLKNRPNAPGGQHDRNGQLGNRGDNHPAAGSGDRIQNRPHAQSGNRPDNHPAANAGNRVQNRPETQQGNRADNHPNIGSGNQIQNRPATQRQNSAFSGIQDGHQAQRNSDRGSQSIASHQIAQPQSAGGGHSIGSGGGGGGIRSGGGGGGGGGRSFGGGGGGGRGGGRRR